MREQKLTNNRAMDKFDKLIDEHFGVIMSHKAASVQHYLETGNISGTFRMSLRHMLSDACEGKKADTGENNALLPDVVEQLPQQICYKTNEPCKHNCQGLCKESC